MNVMYGADADELEALAAELEAHRDELGSLLAQGVGAVSLVGLSATLHTVWRGPRAGEFGALWQSRHLLKVHGVQDLLSDAVNDLRANAEQQRATSRSNGPVGDRPLSPYERATITGFEDALGGSDAEQATYWNGLDEFERRLLIERKPGWVLSLRPLGLLSESEVAAAQEAFDLNELGEMVLVERSVGEAISGEVHLGFVQIRAEASGSISEVMTGEGPKYHVELAVEGDVALALGTSEASVAGGVGGGLTLVYEFDSEAEADRFLDEVKEMLKPDRADRAQGFFTSPFTGGLAGGVATATLTDVKGYLDTRSGHLESSRVDLRAIERAEVDADGFEAAVERSAGAFYDTKTGERGIALDLSGEVRAELDVFAGAELEGSLETHAHAEMVWDDDGRPKELKLEIEVEAQAGVDIGNPVGELVGPIDDLAIGGGGQASVTAVLDMSNPRNRGLAERALSGDSGAIKQLMGNATVAVQVGGVTESHTEYEAGIGPAHGELRIGRSAYQNAATWVKAPQSGFERI